MAAPTTSTMTGQLATAGSSVPSAPGARFTRTQRRLRAIGWNLLPPLTFVAIIALWAGSVRLFSIPAYLLPGPGAVFGRLISDAGLLWSNALVTLTEIVLGFALTILTASRSGS